MRETKIYCDHCGKVIDDMKDYTYLEINEIECDLCAGCAKELNKVVMKYCGKEGDKVRCVIG